LKANTAVQFLVTRLEIIIYRRTLLARPPAGQDTDHDICLSVAYALLDTLLKIPTMALATNGKSITRKVQYAAKVLPELVDASTS
jgi:hypothetical protein